MTSGKSTYNYVVRFQLKWLGFKTFCAETLAVDECAVGAFDVLDEYLEFR